MPILVDSARLDEIKEALGLGFVTGVTTNPLLIAAAGGNPQTVISAICAATEHPVFYQLTGRSEKEREREGHEFAALGRKDQVVLKIPATTANMRLLATLARDIPCAATAVYSPAQALVAAEAGAAIVIVYVNRATRLLGDGVRLINEIDALFATMKRAPAVLAASIKSPAEAVAAMVAGADEVTMPLAVLRELGNHPLTDQAISEFEQAGR